MDSFRNMPIPCVERAERNQLLRDTDWQSGTDVTMSDAQTAYRKKLRDLPATNSDPTKIVFPDAP
jgi:hypothetical protein